MPVTVCVATSCGEILQAILPWHMVLPMHSWLSRLQVAEPPVSLQAERCIALELERIAVHIGDTAALCGDVAYQLGQVACEALRTMVINTTQFWCGNRFGKGMIRPGGPIFR
jgi:NADH:ubiquinone oxidoreductase subunit D